MLRDKGDYLELDIIVEKFKKQTRNLKVNGKYVFDELGNKIKEEREIYTGYIIVPTAFSKEGITLYGRTLNHQYRIYKNRSTIFDKYSQKLYVVNHKPDEIEQGLNRRSSVGFKINQ